MVFLFENPKKRAQLFPSRRLMRMLYRSIRKLWCYERSTINTHYYCLLQRSTGEWKMMFANRLFKSELGLMVGDSTTLHDAK